MPKIATTIASGKIALKVAAARDIALTLDTMYAYPYDMEAEYDVDLSDFRIKIKENEVQVNLISLGLDPSSAKYGFVAVKYEPNLELKGPKKIFFKKENGIISCNYEQEGAIIACLPIT